MSMFARQREAKNLIPTFRAPARRFFNFHVRASARKKHFEYKYFARQRENFFEYHVRASARRRIFIYKYFARQRENILISMFALQRICLYFARPREDILVSLFARQRGRKILWIAFARQRENILQVPCSRVSAKENF